uniref:Hypothetical secreted peptide n=1 Tax=Triatoma matogrossensis TaxID=162370 RepID=E2J7D1_9HEMI
MAGPVALNISFICVHPATAFSGSKALSLVSGVVSTFLFFHN